jgi:hypothetical protein
MGDEDPLAPTSVAAAIAPIIDRLRMAIARRVPTDAADLFASQGLDNVRGQTMGALRNLLPDRTVHRNSVRDAFAYWPASQVDGALDELVAGGLVRDESERVGLTADGARFERALWARTATFVDELWSAHEGSLEPLGELVARAAAAAMAAPVEGASSVALHTPVFEHEGASAGVLLADRLTPLRFHRADAHIAAWRSAGLTAEQVQVMGPGPQRSAIEAETNRAAAAPYAALTRAERFALVAGLGRLPG